jgi:prevent-host-death family protein
MAKVTAFEAKTRFGELLERVSRGERIVITRRGKPIAVLVPPDAPDQKVDHIVREMLHDRDVHGPKLGGRLTIRDLVQRGRR